MVLRGGWEKETKGEGGRCAEPKGSGDKGGEQEMSRTF